MALPTIVDAYIRAAMKHAHLEKMNDGTIAATVPDAFGVVAFGADENECISDLINRLEEWVRSSRKNGFALPVIGGIDLNSEDGQALAAYHQTGSQPVADNFYEDEYEFESALKHWEKGTA